MMQAQATVVYIDFSTALLSSTSSWAIIHVRVLPARRAATRLLENRRKKSVQVTQKFLFFLLLFGKFCWHFNKTHINKITTGPARVREQEDYYLSYREHSIYVLRMTPTKKRRTGMRKNLTEIHTVKKAKMGKGGSKQGVAGQSGFNTFFPSFERTPRWVNR